MARRLEAAHGSFPLSRRLVRVLSPIVEPFVLPVLDAHQDLPLRCAIARKFVGDEHTWHVLAAFEQFAEELHGSSFVSSALHQKGWFGETEIKVR